MGLWCRLFKCTPAYQKTQHTPILLMTKHADVYST
jgi:hypothetical protein